MAVVSPTCETCGVYVGAHPHVVSVEGDPRRRRRLRVCNRCRDDLVDGLMRELDRIRAGLPCAR